MPYHDKTAKIWVYNEIIKYGVFTLDNHTRVILAREAYSGNFFQIILPR